MEGGWACRSTCARHDVCHRDVTRKVSSLSLTPVIFFPTFSFPLLSSYEMTLIQRIVLPPPAVHLRLRDRWTRITTLMPSRTSSNRRYRASILYATHKGKEREDFI